MGHLKVIGIKFIVIAVVIYSLFGILYNATLMNLFWISLLITGISYLIGDLFILRKFGNIKATIADFGLSFISIWILGSLFFTESMPTIILSLAGALFITCCEPFIHLYLENQLSDDDEKDVRTKNQLQTEFAEETDTQSITQRKKGREDK
ncbi:MAG TPA: YndM family protein [Virgibacillus sp.]|nr:YndM family protein [Virgibacillus sp.]